MQPVEHSDDYRAWEKHHSHTVKRRSTSVAGGYDVCFTRQTLSITQPVCATSGHTHQYMFTDSALPYIDAISTSTVTPKGCLTLCHYPCSITERIPHPAGSSRVVPLVVVVVTSRICLPRATLRQEYFSNVSTPFATGGWVSMEFTGSFPPSSANSPKGPFCSTRLSGLEDFLLLTAPSFCKI